MPGVTRARDACECEKRSTNEHNKLRTVQAGNGGAALSTSATVGLLRRGASTPVCGVNHACTGLDLPRHHPSWIIDRHGGGGGGVASGELALMLA